jgi:hypothetical protein
LQKFENVYLEGGFSSSSLLTGMILSCSEERNGWVYE